MKELVEKTAEKESEYIKTLCKNEIAMNFVELKTRFLNEAFQLQSYENFDVKMGNTTINTKISIRNRIWKIPLKKLGFKAGDKISFIKTGTKELTIQKVS